MYSKTITDSFILYARKISLLSLVLILIATTSRSLAHDSENRDFIITKEPYSRLMVSPLPTTIDGEFDFAEMIVEASMANKWENLNLTPEMEEYLTMEIFALQNEDYSTAEDYWESFIDSLKHYRTPVDLNSVLNLTLRKSYLETNTDLQFLASQLKAINDMKKTLRDELNETSRVRDDYCLPAGTSGTGICDDVNDFITEFTVWDLQLQEIENSVNAECKIPQ